MRRQDSKTEDREYKTGEVLMEIYGKLCVDAVRQGTVNGKYVGNGRTLRMAQICTDPLYAPFLDDSWRNVPTSDLEIEADKEQDLNTNKT